MTERLYHSDEKKIEDLLVGRKIIIAEKGDFDDPDNREWWYGRPEGRLILDDGTVLYLAGNKGGCSCSAGDYDLTWINGTDNVITGVRVEANPDTEDYFDGNQSVGSYRIFVFAENEEINVATFEGSDGNGYYGTGFWVDVLKPEGDG